MNWRFWKKKKPENTLFPQTVTRHMEDVKIMVEEGMHDTRRIYVQGWSPELAESLFWRIRDGLDGKRSE